jgi:hypothetical protein
MKTINDRQYLSDEGKVFIHKGTKDIMGWGICLGVNDSIDNYEEIDCPEEYKGNQDYDNTIKEEEKRIKHEASKLRKNNIEEK